MIFIVVGCAPSRPPLLAEGAVQNPAEAEMFLGRTAKYVDGYVVPKRYAFKIKGVAPMKKNAELTADEKSKLDANVRWALGLCGVDLEATAESSSKVFYSIEESLDAGLDEGSWTPGDPGCCVGKGYDNCEGETITSIHRVKVTVESRSSKNVQTAAQCSALAKHYPRVDANASSSSGERYAAEGWTLVRTTDTWEVCQALAAKNASTATASGP
jgi:hypothetical protein